ncbi:ABC transporter transmembrane protein [Rhodococcus rhodochrous]|uniref:FecCD family ABC transporter permease n=1 Tax=Rhodococcus rhodochrous TaxID=1829 RepID=UPI0007517B4C|nr:iron chelate uptake ABC transporter family permease subunit [Rhodococcus rhodochrous]MDO1486386.1 iron chelate uptake ABC transporter family permease subunit [Rhodococcus rhodochrous]SNV20284.1 ABC transporter transmembrane protein [Rhodococcus rhodochrous]
MNDTPTPSLDKDEPTTGKRRSPVQVSTRVPGRPAFRLGSVSVVWRARMVIVCALIVAATAVLLSISLGRGDYPLSPLQVVEVLLGGGERLDRFIVFDLRLPRGIAAVVVGAALAVSGAITQSVSRNALASPDILGITAGASSAAVALIVVTSGGSIVGLLATLGLPLSALLGALLTATVIYLLAWRRGADGFRLVLIGIGVNAMLIALTQWMLVSADINDVSRAQVWLTGSLNGVSWSQVVPAAIALLLVGGWAATASFTVGALRLGDDTARSLGVKLQTQQALLLIAACALAAVATAAAGPIGFVALAAPQIALRLVGSAGSPIVASALTGALFVVAADLIARTILPVPLPVGLVTSALGGPFLLYLLVRSNRKVSR